MKFAIVGLGKMGFNLALRALEVGCDVVAFNRTKEVTDELRIKNPFDQTQGKQESRIMDNWGELKAAYSYTEIIENLPAPRVIWLMVPAGEVVDEVVNKLIKAGLEAGDVVIDGGNSYYKDSQRRYKELKTKGIHFVDCGTSGGLESARRGPCLMVGGDKDVVLSIEKLFTTIAGKDAYAYFGDSGAGHFVKVIHNGVEYGMLEAIAEGLAVIKNSPLKIDLAKVTKNWNHQSIVSGRLMGWAQEVFARNPNLTDISGAIGGGQTGKWTKKIAEELRVTIPVIAAASDVRDETQTRPSFVGKVVNAIRNAFGGHEVKNE